MWTTCSNCGKVTIDNEPPSRFLEYRFEGVRRLADEEGIRWFISTACVEIGNPELYPQL